MPRTYEPIASQTLGADASSITFSSIPQTFTDLFIVKHALAGLTGINDYIQYNGDTGSNYSATQLYGDGSTAASYRIFSATVAFAGSYGAAVDRMSTIQIMSYANTSVFKTALVAGGAASGLYLDRAVNLWRSTAAITSITLLPYDATNWKTGSTFSLYGIKAA